jgi:hypothetical protein
MRTLTKVIVVILAILAAELLHTYAHHYFHSYSKGTTPYKVVAISMAVAVLVFFPIFHYLEKFIHSASEKYVEGAKQVTNNRFVGLLLGFAVAIFLLFAGFAQAMYHKNVIADIKNWIF